MLLSHTVLLCECVGGGWIDRWIFHWIWARVLTWNELSCFLSLPDLSGQVVHVAVDSREFLWACFMAGTITFLRLEKKMLCNIKAFHKHVLHSRKKKQTKKTSWWIFCFFTAYKSECVTHANDAKQPLQLRFKILGAFIIRCRVFLIFRVMSTLSASPSVSL